MAAEFDLAPDDPTRAMRGSWVTVIPRFPRSSSGIAETQGEPRVQPDAMADDLTRGPVEGFRAPRSSFVLPLRDRGNRKGVEPPILLRFNAFSMGLGRLELEAASAAGDD